MQGQEEQISTLQGELAEASQTIEQLSSQLKQAKRSGSLVSLVPQSQLDGLQRNVAELKRELEMEVQRREEVRSLERKDVGEGSNV